MYVAVVQNLFNRLPNVPSELVQLSMIKRNLLPYLSSAIALQPVYSISELVRYCRVLEDAQLSAMQFKPPPPINNSLLEPDLAFRKNTTLFSCDNRLSTQPH